MLAHRNNGRALVNVVIVLVLLVAAGVLFSHGLRSTARVKAVKRDTAVDAVTGTVAVTADGGYREVKSEAAGKVVQAQAIHKESHFKKGDPLVKLDTTDLDREEAEAVRNFTAVQERAKIQLENNTAEKVAEETLANATRLFDAGRATSEQVKTAQRALDAVRKQLKLDEFDRAKGEADHKARMEDFKIRRERMTVLAPPIDGVVQTPLTWEGALIGSTQPVAIVYSNERVVAAKISEENFGKVKIGQEANLRLLTHGSQGFKAKVSKLLPTADEAQRFEVWLAVELPPEKISEMLLPGSTGEVTITVDRRPNAVMIPRIALFDSDKICVVNDGRVEKRLVKVGHINLTEAEILNGVAEGEQVIVDMPQRFRNGDRVRIEVVP